METKEKHPTWFKMKIERRQLIKQLPAETAVTVLLACWDYLETGEIPDKLDTMEKIAFSAFFPDMEEAWQRYEQRITARQRKKSTDIDRYRTISNETEEETETETEEEYIYPLNPPAGETGSNFSDEMKKAVDRWMQYKRERGERYKHTAAESLMTTVSKHLEQYPEKEIISLIQESMANNWKGIAWNKLEKPKEKKRERWKNLDDRELGTHL